jgi:hypothetical protein
MTPVQRKRTFEERREEEAKQFKQEAETLPRQQGSRNAFATSAAARDCISHQRMAIIAGISVAEVR